MYENKCVICGQPIIGYWYSLEENNICQSCAASTTVYDLFQRDIIDIKPDIVDGDATLVTKDDMAAKSHGRARFIEVGRKAAADVVAKIESGEMDGDIDGIDYSLPASENNPDALR